MAHNLSETNGKTSMMYVGETPWHGLGTKLDKPATAAEAIVSAGLDYTVMKLPMKTISPELAVENHFATVRTDSKEVLGVVGSCYLPVQNRDAFSFFDSLVGEGEAIYHTAGALGKGERIWLLAKLPDYIRINDNDIVEKFLLLSNTHDGSSTIRVKLTPVRVVCHNTLSVALDGSEQEVSIRHTVQAVERLKKAHEILGLSNSLYAELERIFNRMKNTEMSKGSFNQYVNRLFPEPKESKHISRNQKVREKIFELSESGVGAEMAKGSLWGGYNAVTEFVDHYRLSNKDDSSRLNSMLFGSGEALKKKAFTLAREMVN
jgi:phage/plasmid-like protein (TIGR03299 family)